MFLHFLWGNISYSQVRAFHKGEFQLFQELKVLPVRKVISSEFKRDLSDREIPVYLFAEGVSR